MRPNSSRPAVCPMVLMRIGSCKSACTSMLAAALSHDTEDAARKHVIRYPVPSHVTRPAVDRPAIRNQQAKLCDERDRIELERANRDSQRSMLIHVARFGPVSHALPAARG